MNVLEALGKLGADGALLLTYKDRTYRVVIRSGLVRAVYDEGQDPHYLLDRQEAEAFLAELAAVAREVPAEPGYAVHPITDPVRSVYVPIDIFRKN